MKVKRLIPAVAMLLISAMLLGTSTFAWFSMNTQVTAESIAIQAKSNARYLLINDTGTAASGDETLDISPADTVALYPAYYATSTTMPGTAATGASLATTAGTWYTANNKNTNNATNATTNVRAIDDTDATEFADYVYTTVMYLTLSSDSEAWANYLKITVTKDDGDAAAKMILKVENPSGGTPEIINVGVGGTSYVDCSTTNLTNAACIKVTAYTYIDGTSTNVYSDFTGAPSSLTGEFSFTFDLSETNT